MMCGWWHAGLPFSLVAMAGRRHFSTLGVASSVTKDEHASVLEITCLICQVILILPVNLVIFTQIHFLLSDQCNLEDPSEIFHTKSPCTVTVGSLKVTSDICSCFSVERVPVTCLYKIDLELGTNCDHEREICNTTFQHSSLPFSNTHIFFTGSSLVDCGFSSGVHDALFRHQH